MLRLRGGCTPPHTEGEIHILYVTSVLRQRAPYVDCNSSHQVEPLEGLTISYRLKLKL